VKDVLEASNRAPADNKFLSSYTSAYYDTPEMSRALPKAEVEIGGPTGLDARKLPQYKEFRNKAEGAWVKTKEVLVDDWERVRRLIDDPNVKVDTDQYILDILKIIKEYRKLMRDGRVKIDG